MWCGSAGLDAKERASPPSGPTVAHRKVAALAGTGKSITRVAKPRRREENDFRVMAFLICKLSATCHDDKRAVTPFPLTNRILLTSQLTALCKHKKAVRSHRTAFQENRDYVTWSCWTPTCGGGPGGGAREPCCGAAPSPSIHSPASFPAHRCRSSLPTEPGSSAPRSDRSCPSVPRCGSRRCPSRLPDSSSCSPRAAPQALLRTRDDDGDGRAPQAPGQSCPQLPESHRRNAAGSVQHRPGSPSRRCPRESDAACRG